MTFFVSGMLPIELAPGHPCHPDVPATWPAWMTEAQIAAAVLFSWRALIWDTTDRRGPDLLNDATPFRNYRVTTFIKIGGDPSHPTRDLYCEIASDAGLDEYVRLFRQK